MELHDIVYAGWGAEGSDPTEGVSQHLNFIETLVRIKPEMRGDKLIRL